MVHPNIDLEKITADLEAAGFEAITRLQFRRGFLDVRVVNGLLPNNIDFVPEVCYQVSAYNRETGMSAVWHCPIDSFRLEG